MKNYMIFGAVVLAAAVVVWWLTTQSQVELIKTDSAVQNIEAPAETVTEEVQEPAVDLSAGTQLAGTETPTVDSEGNALIGGDAVSPEETPGEVSFTVLGGNFYYDIEEIKVKEGDTVTINFRSVDGFHDWVVDEFSAATEKVSTGGETSVTFTADKKGSYEYYCSVGSHRANGMVGTLIVE